MKNFAVLSLVLLAVCVWTSSGQSHSISWGYAGPYDQLLSRDIVVEKFKFFRVVSEDYVYPPKGQFNYRNITSIRVTDQYTDGSGGYASLIKGGVGARNVTIHLKSQRNHGFNFIIEIFGRY